MSITPCAAPRQSRMPDPRLPIYRAEDLTDGGVQAVITLDDQPYLLRITKQGKLLLTK